MLCFENDEVKAYYYDPRINRMIDEDGYIICDIFSIITPNDLYLFKFHKEYTLIKNKFGELIELYYPEDEDYIDN